MLTPDVMDTEKRQCVSCGADMYRRKVSDDKVCPDCLAEYAKREQAEQ